MKKLIYFIIAVATLSSCYEYRKLPNTKRVKKRDVRKAMKYSTWQYNNAIPKQHSTTFRYKQK